MSTPPAAFTRQLSVPSLSMQITSFETSPTIETPSVSATMWSPSYSSRIFVGSTSLFIVGIRMSIESSSVQWSIEPSELRSHARTLDSQGIRRIGLIRWGIVRIIAEGI